MQDVLKVIREFDAIVDDAVALYLDAQSAMIKFSEFLAESQRISAADLGVTVARMDILTFTYGQGDPNDQRSRSLHSTTQGAVKRRNAKGGRNHLILGQRFIVDLYTFWEDGYRTKLAEAAKRDRISIRSDVFGDIRHLRNSVIHHLGVALPEISKCKTLTWFRPGDTIDIREEAKFHALVSEVRGWLEAFGSEVAGASPGLLTRFGPSGHLRI